MRHFGPGRRAVLAAPLALLVADCGFHPIYAPGAGGTLSPVQADLAAISVGIIPERSGQLLRQALQERFERGGIGVARRYDLGVAYALNGEGVGVQQDASVTRIRVTATALWALATKGVQPTTLGTGTVRSVDGFDIVNEQYFAVDLTNDEVNRRLAAAVADQVTLQIATYFQHHPASG